jgi:putative ABC transport system substrate-binding protein
MASDLVRRQVAVIAATGSPAAVHAAKAATTSIPIVGFLSGDPVADGLVASFNRPGGNVTGVSMFAPALGAKRFELLCELVPNSAVVGLLVDPGSPDQSKPQLSGAEAAARAIGQQIAIFNAGSEAELARVFMTLAEQRVGALLVLSSAFITSQRDKIVALAAQYRIPTMYQWREYTTAGGLASYGESLADGYRQVGVYAGRLLKGEKPADLPVLRPTKFEFVINLKTAKALGLAIPDKLLAIADEVIE